MTFHNFANHSAGEDHIRSRGKSLRRVSLIHNILKEFSAEKQPPIFLLDGIKIQFFT